MKGIIDSILDLSESFKEKEGQETDNCCRIFIWIILGIAALLTCLGIKRNKDAKSINKKALAIVDEANNELKIHKKQVEKALTELGSVELEVSNSFSHFADLIDSISDRPEFKTKPFAKVKLPDIKVKEFKALPNNLKVAIDSAGGAAAGVVAGLGTLGVSAFLAAPGALGMGIVLCVKGISANKKANSNLQDAKAFRKQANDVIALYDDIRNAADSLRNSIELVYKQYLIHLERLAVLVDQKQNYNTCSKNEKKTVENTYRMAILLFEMCKVSLVMEPSNDSELEKANKKDVKRYHALANNLLAKTA